MSLATRATDIAADSATKAAEVVTALVTQAKQALTAKRSLEETERLLVARGAMHEWRYELVDGVVQKVFVSAPTSARHLWLSTKVFGSRDYVVYEKERLSYEEAHRRVAVIANMLQKEFGIKKGDRVAIAMRNLPEWLLTFWAVACIGAVTVAVNAWLPPEALVHVITRSGASVCIFDEERARKLRTVFKDLKRAGVREFLASRLQEPIRDLQSFEELVSKHEAETTLPEVEIKPDDPMLIFTTSGTTAMPKLVPSTHRMYVSNLLNSQLSRVRAILRRGEDVPPPDPNAPQKGLLLTIPLFHATGNHSLMQMSTAAGGKIVMVRKWDADEAVRLIKEEKLTTAGGVPSMAAEIIAHEKQSGETTLEGLMFGGCPPSLRLPQQAAEKFRDTMVSQGYGLTETNAYAVGFAGEDYVARPTSTGLPSPIVELLIMDQEKNSEKRRGQTGEIWLRGCTVVRQYYNDPEASAEAFTKDGWFKTGDLGWLDEEGFLYVADRAKDVIIRGGENIASTSVENAIYSDDRIFDAAVVAVPDERLGELVAAVVTPKKQHRGSVTEESVMETVRKVLPKHCVPVMVDVREEMLERNANGKIVKKELKERTAKLWKARKGSKM